MLGNSKTVSGLCIRCGHKVVGSGSGNIKKKQMFTAYAVTEIIIRRYRITGQTEMHIATWCFTAYNTPLLNVIRHSVNVQTEVYMYKTINYAVHTISFSVTHTLFPLLRASWWYRYKVKLYTMPEKATILVAFLCWLWTKQFSPVMITAELQMSSPSVN